MPVAMTVKLVSIAIFSIVLFAGASVIAGQWSFLQTSLQVLSNRVTTMEATVEVNSQRIQNQHIRLSTLEIYNKEVTQLLRDVKVNTEDLKKALESHRGRPVRDPVK